MKRVAFALTVFSISPVLAEETRQLDSHVHGTGQLNIAIEGTTIALELHSPGADIVGFEHPAESSEDRTAIENAVAILARPLDLFVPPPAAECTVVEARAKLEGDQIKEGHDHEHDDHEEHAGHDDHDHDHEEHADHDEHAHDEHEDHAGHDHAETHTEFHAEYTLACANPGALEALEFAYFDQFENAETLQVQIVSDAGARAFDVTREDPTLDLRNLF